MATLSPTLDVIERQKVKPTEGERTLLNFLLKNLDDSYEIFYQPFLNGDNPDFAIMRKGSGVVLIEVKDWILDHYYIDDKTKWRLRKDDTVLKSPLKQVDNYKDNLFHLHLEELFQKSIRSKNHWTIVNCAVYFHNASEEGLTKFLLANFEGNKYLSYQKFVSYFGLLGKNSLTPEYLNRLLTKFWMNKASYYFDDKLYNSFGRYLNPPVHQIEEGIEIQYTKEQQEFIRSEVRPRRKIKGVAGSGKTLVLAKRAVNAHKRTGSLVLILTYNLSLKNYIRDRISDVREKFYWSNFYITNYHQFFKTQANNYNIDITGLDCWEDTRFFEKVKNSIVKYDIVLIDEIQDYQQEWIDIIAEYFIHSETEFVVFGDEKQNIYERELDENNEPIVRRIPGNWNKSLKVSQRFTSNIAKLAVKFQKSIFGLKYNADEINVFSQIDFEKRIIEYHYFQEFTSRQLYEAVYSVLESNQIHSSDCGILCSKVEILRDIDYFIRTIKHEQTKTTFETQEEYSEFKNNKNLIDDIRRVKKNSFWMKTGTVKLSTVHSFKGWEIDTLFLFIEKEEDEKVFVNAELIYTGLTRARRNLIIFNLSNRKYDAFFRAEIETVFDGANKSEPKQNSELVKKILEVIPANDYFLLRLICCHYNFTIEDIKKHTDKIKFGSGVLSWYESDPFYQNASCALYGLCFNHNFQWSLEILQLCKFEANSYQWTGYDQQAIPLLADDEIKAKIFISQQWEGYSENNSLPANVFSDDELHEIAIKEQERIEESQKWQNQMAGLLTEDIGFEGIDSFLEFTQSCDAIYALSPNLFSSFVSLLNKHKISIMSDIIRQLSTESNN